MSVSYRNKYITHIIMSFRRTPTLGSQSYRQSTIFYYERNIKTSDLHKLRGFASSFNTVPSLFKADGVMTPTYIKTNHSPLGTIPSDNLSHKVSRKKIWKLISESWYLIASSSVLNPRGKFLLQSSDPSHFFEQHQVLI